MGYSNLGSQLKAGEPVPLSDSVTRVLARNPGMMTGPGTNSYLVGQREVAVIDPGPMDETHVNAILQAAKGRIRWVLVTHTHLDHSPGAQLLVEKTGAELIAFEQQAEGFQDKTCQPSRPAHHRQTLETDEFSLTALHTPGHASNHLCYFLQDEGMLFTGDHIMQGSTVVIAPTDGNMTHYLDSLTDLKQESIDKLAPGHGHVIEKAIEEIDKLISHRLMRERKVIEALQTLGNCDLELLLKNVYDDVPVFLHPVAQLSLHAHLIRLAELGQVARHQNDWVLCQ